MTTIQKIGLVVSLLSLDGCRRAVPLPPSSTWLKSFPMNVARRELHLIAPDVIAAGDTVALLVDRFQCRADVCSGEVSTARDPLRDAWTWRVEQTSVGSIDARRRLIARHAGITWVAASKGDTLLRRRVQVLPPVATIGWEPAAAAVSVGDTLRLRAVARDSSGRIVGQLRMLSRLGGEGSADADVLQWGGPTGIVVAVNSPGIVELRTSLGKRHAVFRTVVIRR